MITVTRLAHTHGIKHKLTARLVQVIQISHLHLCQLSFESDYLGIFPFSIHRPQGVILLGGSGMLDTAHLCLQSCKRICCGAIFSNLQRVKKMDGDIRPFKLLQGHAADMSWVSLMQPSHH